MKDFKNQIFLFFILIFSYEQMSFSGNIKFPFNNSVSFEKNIKIEWSKNNICNNYHLEISTDENFLNVIYKTDTSANSLEYIYPSDGTYFIRVKPSCLSNWSSSKFSIMDLNIEKPNIENWFSADINTTISSGRVTKWDDVLDSTSKFVQNSSINNCPLLITNDSKLNYKPLLHFKPANTISFLNFQSNVSLADATFILLYQLDLSNNSIQQHFIAGTGANGYFAQNANGNTGFGIFSTGNSNVAQRLSSGFTDVDSTFTIYSATKTNLYKNGIEIPSQGTITDSIRFSRIGSRPGLDNLNFKGKVAEILIFNKKLSEVEINTWNNYLFTKYAPPINLGDDTIVGNSFSDSIILDASNRFVKYLWTTGDTTQTIKAQTDGSIYGVWVTDVFGRTSYDEIRVAPYNYLNNDTVNICEGNSFTINLNINTSNFNLKWLDNNSTAVTRTFNQEGQYIVEITDVNNKKIYDTINIVQDKFFFNKPVLSGNVISGCVGENLILSANSGIDSVLWSNGSTSSVYTITGNETVTVQAQSLIGCPFNQTFSINAVGQKPNVDFNVLSPTCENQEILFGDATTVASSDLLTQWQWTFSDTTNSNQQNPLKTFTSMGNKTITLKVTTDKGCSDEITKQISLEKKPRAFFDNLLACSGIPVQFRDLSTPNADSISAWNWNFNDIGSSTQKNPTFAFPSNQLYYVHLKATNTNGCYDTITKYVGINPGPNSNFVSNTSGCVGSAITFNNTSSIDYPLNIISYNWNFGDGVQDNTLVNTSHTYDSSGVYDVSLAIRASNQCVDTFRKTVTIYAKPNADFTISNNQCVGLELQFTDISTTSDNSTLSKWNWSFGGVSSSTAQNPKHTFNEQGNYLIQLNAETNKGCKDYKVKSIVISQPPMVGFTFSPTVGLPPLAVNFINQSPPSNNFVWNFGDGSPTFNGQTPPTHTYTTIGTYPISLSASNLLGCTNTVTKMIIVDQPNMDAALIDLSTIKNNDFYKVLVSIQNNGNAPIYNMGLTIRLGSGTLVRENWTGFLLPGAMMSYTFNSELKFNEQIDIPVVCANIESINFDAIDTDPSNNTNCKDVKVGKLALLTIYPNPTNGMIKVGVMFPEITDYTFTVYNELAQTIRTQTGNSTKGYNLLDVDLSDLPAAIYTVEIRVGNEVLRKRVWKK